MLTNEEILKLAMQQSAIDLGCQAADFLSHENKVVLSRPHGNARKYLTLPFFCNFVSYGHNVIASVSPAFVDAATQYINSYPVEHCFETPNMNALLDRLRPHGHGICFMAEYFLPDVNAIPELSCPYPIKPLLRENFQALYLPKWSNALCKERAELDRIAFGAYDGETLVGLAGASADCESMWQIGIDVLPDYRGKGIASALTSRLAAELLSLDIVPFYCAAWSNIPSVRNAIKSGFRPAWVELTAKPFDMIAKMNRVD